MLKHKVRITVGEKNPVIQSGQRTLRGRFLDWMFGVRTGVFVLTPGRSVETVEIMELPEEGGGLSHETGSNKTAG